jgi:hypothetical protein
LSVHGGIHDAVLEVFKHLLASVDERLVELVVAESIVSHAVVGSGLLCSRRPEGLDAEVPREATLWGDVIGPERHLSFLGQREWR